MSARADEILGLMREHQLRREGEDGRHGSMSKKTTRGSLAQRPFATNTELARRSALWRLIPSQPNQRLTIPTWIIFESNNNNNKPTRTMTLPSTISGRLIGLVSLACLVLASGSMGVQAANTNQGQPSEYTRKPCNKEQAKLIFPGLTAAISARKGAVEIVWPAAEFHDAAYDFNGEECEDITYEAFVVEGAMNFADASLEDLRADESVYNHETTELFHAVENLKVGAHHSLLVVAKVGDDWVSSNREFRPVQISTVDPVLNQRNNVIYLEEDTDYVWSVKEGDEVFINFPESQSGSFKEGDWITGNDRDGEPYIVNLISVLDTDSTSGEPSSGIVAWRAKTGTLSDIYDRLDMSSVVKVPKDPGDSDGSGGSGGGTLQSRIEYLSAAQITFQFEKSESIGPIDIDYSVEFSFWLDSHVSMGVHWYGKPYFDASVAVSVVLEQTASLTVTKSISSDFSKTIALHKWKGRWVTFVVGGVPVSIKVTPITDLVLEAEANLEASFGVSATSRDEYDWQASYVLGKGWGPGAKSPDPERHFNYDISASASLDLYGGLRLGADVALYGVLKLSPFVEAGPRLSIEAASTPKELLLPSHHDHSINELFHFTKFDVDLGYAIGAIAAIQINLNVFGFKLVNYYREHIFKYSKDIALSKLPTVKFVATTSRLCSGQDLAHLEIEIEETDFSGLFSNKLGSQHKLALAPAGNWEIGKESENSMTVSLIVPHSAANPFPQHGLRLDDQTLYFAANATIPPLPFPFLLFAQDLKGIEGQLGVPDDFECCNNLDCGGGVRVCEGFRCFSIYGSKCPDGEICHQEEGNDSNSEL